MGSAALTVVQVVLGAIWLPVHTVAEVFDLMERAPVLGLISWDVLLVINNILVLLLYLGLCVVLWPVFRSGVTVACALECLSSLSRSSLRLRSASPKFGPPASSCAPFSALTGCCQFSSRCAATGSRSGYSED